MKTVLVVAILALATAQKVVKLTESSEDEQATCKAGETLAFHIPFNPSTGYKWVFTPSAFDTASLVTGPEGTYLPGEAVPGAPGLQEFLLKCHEKAQLNDTYSFTLVKRRAWEDSSVQAKTVLLRVEA